MCAASRPSHHQTTVQGRITAAHTVEVVTVCTALVAVVALCAMVGVRARNKAVCRMRHESEYCARPRWDLRLGARASFDGTDTDTMLPHLSEDMVMAELSSSSCGSLSNCGSSVGSGQ